MSTINPVVISDTFQVWLNRTNEVIDTINDNALLVSAGAANPRIGNAEIQGIFTADAFIGDAATLSNVTLSTITRETNPTDFIAINSPVQINAPGSSETILDLKTNAGFRPIVGLTNGANRKWEVAVETSDASSPFVIRTGTGVNPQLRLTTGGILTVTALEGDIIGDVIGDVTGTVSSIANHTTDGLPEGSTNRYFTNAGARAALSGGTGVTYNNSTGVIAIGQPVATTSNVNFANAALTGSLTIRPTTNAAIEHGRIDGVASSPFIDFHSSGNNIDYDSRIIAYGGNASVGNGALQYHAAGGHTFTGGAISATSFSGSLNSSDLTGAISASIIPNLNASKINAGIFSTARIPFEFISGAAFVIGFTSQLGSFNDGSNYFDIFPPAGRTMSNIVAFIPSIHVIHFSGDVNDDDSMRNTYGFLSDRIRVYVQNTEQRSAPAANWLAIWTRS